MFSCLRNHQKKCQRRNAPQFFRIRLQILREHGPIDPVNYFKRELYRVRGTTAEDVRETLLKLLTLHNRAAKDYGVEALQEKDLCYPFLEAFPLNIRATLERQLALIFAQDQPFQHLYRLAPSKRNLPVEDCEIIKDVDRTTNQNQLVEILAMALQQATHHRQEAVKRRKVTSAPNANHTPIAVAHTSNCLGCGGTCRDRRNCPAANQKCHSCGLTGHWARVCRRANPFSKGPAKPL